MLLTRNLAVLLLALVGVSSAAVDRRDSVSRGRHLAAAAVHRDVGDLLQNIGALLAGDTDTLSSSTTTSETTTDPASTSTDVDSTSAPVTQDEPTQDPTTTTTDSTTTTPAPADPPTSSDVETTTTTTTTTTTDTATDGACTPVVLLGITIPCDQPTNSLSETETTQTTDEPTATDPPETTAPPTTTTTDGPESTAPPECTPQVVLGVTVSACGEPTATDSTVSEPTISSTSGVVTGTDEPTTTVTDSPTTTEPPVECTPEVVLGVTVSACESTTAGPGPDPTTTTTSATATNTPDPCDPSLLDPLLGGVLPGFCNPTTTNTGTGTGTGTSETVSQTQDPTTTGTQDPTGTGTQDPPTTTSGTASETTTPGGDPTTETTTTTTTQTLDPNPTDLFPTGSNSDGEPTWSTTVGNPETETFPSFTIPDFVTATSSLIIDTELPTVGPNPTVTDPDAVPVETTPEGQQAVPTPGTAQLGGLPAYIMSSQAPKNVPAGMTLVTFMLTEQLNWKWVADDKDLPLQLLLFAPRTVMSALKLDQSQVPMLAIEAWIPQNWDQNPKNLRTLLEFYMPSDYVDELQHQIMVPTSEFYTAQQDAITKTIVMYVDPTYPLTASSGSNDASSPTGTRAGGNLGGLLGNDSTDDKDDVRKRAIIGVCAAIGALLLLGAIWWGYKNYQHKREQAHRRLSQNSDTQFAGAGGGGAYGAADYGGAGGMQERGRRDSFFFAADSLRGYEDGRFDDSETFDHRSMAPTTGGALSARTGHVQGGHGQPIQPGAISAPILRENTLNW